MKYHNDTSRDMPRLTLTADVLVEAFPWIKQITGKTVVIKYGGSAMVDEKLRSAVMSDIVLLKIIGVNPIIIHGGGNAITAEMDLRNIPVEFIEGYRVTSDEAMEVVKMVLVGQVNQELVGAMNEHGTFSVGVSGSDAGTIMAKQKSPALQRVGEVTRINTTYIEDLIAADYIPVLASVALGEDGGYYNVNADMAAGYVASAIGAHKIIFLTDVDGLYEDFDDKNTLISRLAPSEAQAMIDEGKISTGMIPKLNSCVQAMEDGVSSAHMINGTIPHSLLLELFTDSGIGTALYVQDDDEPEDFEAHPLGNFASKLDINLGDMQ